MFFGHMEMKKKVLFVATVDSHIELFHLPYLKMFKDKGWEVHVATDTDKPIKYCDKKVKLPIARSPFRLGNLKAIRELRKVMQAEKYDIVHCHTPMGGVVARLAAKKMRRQGTRVIYTAHGFHFYKGAPLHFWLMFYPVEWYLAKFTDTLITINHEDHERAQRKFSRRCRDIQYVPGVGVDEKKFEKKMTAQEKKELRRSLGLTEEDKVLIFPAELSKRKNQTWLIKTLKPVFNSDKKCHLLLPGKDSLNGKCQRLARELGIEKQVHFLGFRDDIDKLMQISDVAVSSAKQEGLPVNLIEAAFAGLPIVATDCRGNRDVCKACGERAVVLGDADAFAKGILKKNNKVTVDMEEYASGAVGEMMRGIYFRKKRVLHVLASNKYSGAENVVCTIIRNMSDEFEMAYCSPRGKIEEVLKEQGVKYIGLEKLKRCSLKAAIREFGPDIVHAHDYSASIVAANVNFGGKIISHLHNNNPFARTWNPKTIIYALYSRRFDKVVGVSSRVLEEAVFRKMIADKFVVLYNYVDYDNVVAKSGEYVFSGEYDLCFIGREVPQKTP